MCIQFAVTQSGQNSITLRLQPNAKTVWTRVDSQWNPSSSIINYGRPISQQPLGPCPDRGTDHHDAGLLLPLPRPLGVLPGCHWQVWPLPGPDLYTECELIFCFDSSASSSGIQPPSLWITTTSLGVHRAQELCESQGSLPGLPIPNKTLWFLWTQSTMKEKRKRVLLNSLFI